MVYTRIKWEGVGEIKKVVTEVVREKIIGALKKMKGGKAGVMDGIVIEMLNNGGISITDWFLRIFNKCMESGGLEGSVYRLCILRER